jgi:hypothetical protein
VSKISHFGAYFVGYKVKIVALENDVEVDYAMLDFISGCVMLNATDGHVSVPKLSELAPFVASLPKHVDKLEETSKNESGGIKRAFGNKVIYVAPAADLKQVIRQLAKRCSEVEHVLRQAETIGSQINYQPYSEYIDEIEKTHICRMQVGVAVFDHHGNLSFWADPRDLLAKLTEAESPFSMKLSNEPVNSWLN